MGERITSKLNLMYFVTQKNRPNGREIYQGNVFPYILTYFQNNPGSFRGNDELSLRKCFAPIRYLQLSFKVRYSLKIQASNMVV